MGTLKPGSHHEVLRSVCPRLCGPCPPPTTPLPSPPSSTDSHTEPWPPLGMPCLTLLPTSHMPTPQLSTTPSTPDSSTQLLSPTSTMPQAMSLTTLPLKPRLMSTTPLAMLKK